MNHPATGSNGAEAHPFGRELARAAQLRRAGSAADADQLCQALLARDPACGPAWRQLGESALDRGDLGSAEAMLRRASHYQPNADVLHDLGLVLLRLRREHEAIALLQQSVEMAPQAASIANLGLALQRVGRITEAIAHYRRAIELEPGLAEIRSNLASALKDAGDVETSIAEYERAIALAPQRAGLVSNLLWAACHQDGVTAEDLYGLHRRLGARFGSPRPGPAPRPRGPGERIRLGLVSADLRRHPVAHFLLPVLRALDKSRFSVHAYSGNETTDVVTADVRRCCDGWVEAFRLGDDALADRIRAEGIDILLDLSGHTAGNRLPVFARRAAPVQATWIGYPCTTGLAGMDYLLSDAVFTPPGLADRLFTEKIVRLPGAAAFEPAVGLPAIRPLPALERGFVTFGSFHRPAKLTPATLRGWGSLLAQLPAARLVLGNCDDGQSRDSLRRTFGGHGVDPARLEFHSRLSLNDYLALHHGIDLALDTFGFSGGTTTFHSLFMGVPVITAMGEAMPARQTATVLTHAGLGGFVAPSPAAFAARAVDWSQRLHELATVRVQLRERLQALPIVRDSVVARAFETALAAMWDRCACGLPPAAMAVAATGDVTIEGSP